MTTLKPQLIRADTLDLQNQDAPSAKDHTRQPTHPQPLGAGPAAPHQSQTLRHAEKDSLTEQYAGPHIAQNPNLSQGFYDDHDDGEDDDEHGPSPDEDGEYGDQEGDDDDMMDKISSSPSIDDGKYTLPFVWPTRSASLSQVSDSSNPPSTPPRSLPDSSSSPFDSTPDHFPLFFGTDPSEHHQGGYSPDDDSFFHPTTQRSQTSMPQQQTYKVEHDPGAYNLTPGEFEYFDEDEMQNFLSPFGPCMEDDDYGERMVEGADNNSNDSAQEDHTIQTPPESDSDDDSDSFQFTDDSRFIDSGWGGECLRETEDIDFEFVYALHTFVATVEGQANATKGDTMVLLDDSNSYWWLVRVVKDGSIGYLPAEHIETPTERLARLNKHRNIDLSATMLGDNAEKSKNPLKKAMRRRNAKQVQFAAPTYHEPVEIEYSDDEEGEEGEEDQMDGSVADPESTNGQEEQLDEPTASVEPLRIRTNQPSSSTNGIKLVDSNDSKEQLDSPEQERASDDLVERRDDTLVRSRNGVVRNTDSFFKDEETKKISLTPRLLRGDSDSPDVESAKPRASLDAFDKLSADEKDKKKKDKKSGVLSGLFKRKDKKGKLDVDGTESEKVSEELSRSSPQPKDSHDFAVQDIKAAKSEKEKSPQRQPSKLQKSPPAGVSPKVSPTKEESFKESPQLVPESRSPVLKPVAPALTLRPINEEQTSQRVRGPEARSPTAQQAPSSVSREDMRDPSALASSPTEPSIRPVDAFEEEEDLTPPVSQIPTGMPRQTMHDQQTQRRQEYGSHAPTEVSPQERAEDARSTTHPPGLIQDTSSSERRSESPASASLSSVHSAAGHDKEGDRSTNPTTSSPQADVPLTPSTTRSNPSWSDASLRSYMDNDDDIRDLLIIVHDKSNVTPVGSDHPVTGKLFGAEKDRLAEMQSNLDNLLSGFLARKVGTRLPA